MRARHSSRIVMCVRFCTKKNKKINARALRFNDKFAAKFSLRFEKSSLNTLHAAAKNLFSRFSFVVADARDFIGARARDANEENARSRARARTHRRIGSSPKSDGGGTSSARVCASVAADEPMGVATARWRQRRRRQRRRRQCSCCASKFCVQIAPPSACLFIFCLFVNYLMMMMRIMRHAARARARITEALRRFAIARCLPSSSSLASLAFVCKQANTIVAAAVCERTNVDIILNVLISF